MYTWDPNAADWSATAELDLRFMHHERKLLLELDGLDSLAKVRKYVWGPGSVGPPRPTASPSAALDHLLATGDVSGSTDYVCFTNAHGSVVQLLDRSDGSIDAKYVYDVNGDTVSKSGTYADGNPLRYHAMYFDKELDYADTACDGLYCTPTGNYYSPRLGRAVTRGGGRVPGGFTGNVGGVLPYGGGGLNMYIGGGDVYVSPGSSEAEIGNLQDPCANPQSAEDCERCNPPCAEPGFEYAVVNGACVCLQAIQPTHLGRLRECNRLQIRCLGTCISGYVDCGRLCDSICDLLCDWLTDDRFYHLICTITCTGECRRHVCKPAHSNCIERCSDCYNRCRAGEPWDYDQCPLLPE